MPFNKLLYLFSLRLLGFGISWQDGSGLSLNERKFIAVIKDRIGCGVVFDVGAHLGNFANVVRKRCPGARIICYEPHPIACDELRARSHFEVYNVALSNTSGRAKLYSAAEDGLSTISSLNKDTLALFGGARCDYEVEVTTVDQMCHLLKIDHIDLLKIDAEGFDCLVLEGASELIGRRAIEIIEFEFIPACIQTKVYMKDFFSLLKGYKIFRLALNGSLIPLHPYDYRFCEIFATQHLVAMR